MKLIQKANKQLRVDDLRAEAYLKAGYIEVDPKTGKPVGAEPEKPEKTEKPKKAKKSE